MECASGGEIVLTNGNGGLTNGEDWKQKIGNLTCKIAVKEVMLPEKVYFAPL